MSVAPAMKTIPSPWPNTQMNAASTALIPSVQRLSRLAISVSPMTVSSAASSPFASIGLIATPAWPAPIRAASGAGWPWLTAVIICRKLWKSAGCHCKTPSISQMAPKAIRMDAHQSRPPGRGQRRAASEIGLCAAMHQGIRRVLRRTRNRPAVRKRAAKRRVLVYWAAATSWASWPHIIRSHHSGSTVPMLACAPSTHSSARRSSTDTPHSRLRGHRDGADHQRVDGAVVGDLAGLVEGDDKLVAFALQAGIKGGAVIGGHRVRHVRVLPIPLDRLAHLDGHVVRGEPANRVGIGNDVRDDGGGDGRRGVPSDRAAGGGRARIGIVPAATTRCERQGAPSGNDQYFPGVHVASCVSLGISLSKYLQLRR